MTQPSVARPGRIGLCCYSLRQRVESPHPWQRFEQVNFAREAKRVFGIDTVELYNGFLESTHPRYLDLIRHQAQEEGVCLHGMAVDVSYGDLCAADPTQRRIAVAMNMAYVPVAHHLGLAYFRANTGGHLPLQDGELEAAIRSFRELTDVAWDRGIRIAVENHGGLSLDPQATCRLIEAVGRDRMATLPDIGNFGPGDDAYAKIAPLAPYAVAVHAKLARFDESGRATNIDLGRMVEAVSGGGFRGPWSIECVCPDAGKTNQTILQSKALLEKHLPT